MKSQFMFSGIGGQGVISIGELICYAAVEKNYIVTFTPSYGQEKRGGRTMCQIVVSKEMGSPVISEADLLLVMDERSLTDYEQRLKSGGVLIINHNLIQTVPTRKDIQVVSVPVHDIAVQTGNAKTANMVALGVAMQYLKFVDFNSIKAHLKDIFPGKKEKLIAVNEKALEAGYHFSISRV